jgi:uncharacterized protein HemX
VLELAPAHASQNDPSAPVAKPAKSSSNTAPTVLAIIALVIAAAALGIAVVGNARRKSGS